MQSKIFLFILVLSLALCACSGKKKGEPTASQKDLFVEVRGDYFGEQSRANFWGVQTDWRRLERKKHKLYADKQYEWDTVNIAAGPQAGSRWKLLKAARSAIGTPYVVGGTKPGGFDCSGLVCWVYGNIGVKLPRTAQEQSVVGKKICNISDMRAGDIVAFRHPTRGYHTGIYVGDGKFIHSPRRRSHVRINSLSDDYFCRTFLGARRVNLGGRENLLTQAEERLALQDRELMASYSPKRNARHMHSVSDEDGSRRKSKNREEKLAKREKKKEFQEKVGRRGEREEQTEVASKKKTRREMVEVAERKSKKRDRDEVET
ncbi:MAG: C40 family peptidase, partial [Desulfovibrio sp.]|nr:C40 family peptidase [Desulfovibrio sp.]